MHQNGIQHHAPPDDPDSFVSLLLILLCCLTWEWFMILTLFAQLTYVNVIHWIVRLYYYGYLVNEGIGLIFVIQTFYPSAISVLYIRISPQLFLLYDPLFFHFMYLNHITDHIGPILYAFLLYWYYGLYIYVRLYVFTYHYYYHTLCALYILSIIPSSFYANHTI